MKRSEMVERLVFSIELHAGNDPSWLEHDPKVKQRAYDLADRVLRDLEDLGMLPPRIDFMIGEMRASDNAWESEDG